MPYRDVLPLKMMMRHQCVVVGAAQDMLTVAITDRQDISILTLLSKLTGRTIFPVLVDPVRMRLLVQRVDRYQHSRGNVSDYLLYLHRLQVKAMAMPFMYQDTRQK
jgi:Type II secretion system (T2SS), protein E, N-terminal domain